MSALAGGWTEREASAPTADLAQAWAELKDATGKSLGSAILREEEGRVRIVVQVHELSAGRHGIHVHGIGRCEPPAFTSAGNHLNPAGRQHGLENAGGPHAGDLPNLEVDPSGRAEYVVDTHRLTLAPGPTSVFDADWSAVVVHAGPDDQRTDPSGSSGGRIVCGVLVPAPGKVSLR
jgi:Cu-Zn family superoxide dismutase